MRARVINRVLTAALLPAVVCICVCAQTPPASTQGKQTQPLNAQSSTKPRGESTTQPAALKLTEGEMRLAEGSRKAIIETGISAPYFDKHFRLVRVFDKMGDRRVVWKFSVNEYEATVNDAVGFYTEGGKRVDVFSVNGTLAGAHDIQKTITRREAERAMRACIGEFTDGGVTYAAHGSPARATLLLNGSSVVKPVAGASAKKRREEERREKERRERAERERGSKRNPRDKKLPPVDLEEEEDEGDNPIIYVGVIDLETGKCVKGRAIAGPPQP